MFKKKGRRDFFPGKCVLKELEQMRRLDGWLAKALQGSKFFLCRSETTTSTSTGTTTASTNGIYSRMSLFN